MKSKPRMAGIIFAAAAALQLAFLCIVMLRVGGAVLDGDAAKVYVHMKAIVESGTLLIPDWQYITTMELDCALLFALPFYLVSNNAVLAFIAADIVLMLCWVGVLLLLCRRLGLPRGCGWLACLLVLLPYELAMLGYWNMMFLNAAQYGIKILLPLLLAALLLYPQNGDAAQDIAGNGRGKILNGALLAVYLLGVLGTSFSSGIYVAACGLAPVLAVAAWRWLKGCWRLSAYRAGCVFGTVAAVAAGLAGHAAVGVAAKGDAMRLNSVDTVADNAIQCLVGFFRLFGAVPAEGVPVLSAAGLACLLRAAFALALLALAVRGAALIKGGALPQGAGYLLAIFYWNTAVLLLTDTRYGDPYFEYRYHLMGAVPLLVLLAAAAPKIAAAAAVQAPRLRLAGRVCGAGALAAVVLICDWQAVAAIWQPNAFGTNARQRELCGAIATLGVQDVFVEYNASGAEICASLDANHRYIVYMADSKSTVTFDGYLADTDAHSYRAPAALAVLEGSDLEAQLPEGTAQQFSYALTAGGYDVYVTAAPPLLDGAVGLAFGTEGVDYPNSRGYYYQGEMDTHRCLITSTRDGNVVLDSGLLTLHCPTDITLNYQLLEGTHGELQVWQGDNTVAAAPLTPGGTQAVIPALPAGEYRLKVYLNPETKAEIGTIYFRGN